MRRWIPKPGEWVSLSCGNGSVEWVGIVLKVSKYQCKCGSVYLTLGNATTLAWKREIKILGTFKTRSLPPTAS